MTSILSPESVKQGFAKGTFKPHVYLTNLSMAYFQAQAGAISRKIFPMVPVPLSRASFYEFDKGYLTRHGIELKPEMGHVTPAVYGRREHDYKCKVYQALEGIDEISSLDFQRTNTPGAVDPRRGKVRRMAERLNLFLDDAWAQAYFNSETWSHVYEGTASAPTGNQFYFFDNDNCDPVRVFNFLATTMRQFGLRKPNKICMGINVYGALQTNPSILDRIKYQGSEANPADVTVNVLAQLFKVREVVIAETVVNRAKMGAEDDLQFACEPNSLLLVYTTDSPAIDEPSAGYTFTWDMLGNGQYLAVQQFSGPPATHSDFIEGLIGIDHQVAAPDLGVFLKNMVSPEFKISA